MWKRLSALVRGPKVYRAKNLAARERYRADYRILAASLLARLPFDSAIDVGCANGFLLESFLEAGREVTGTEVSAAALEVASPAIRDRIQVRDFARSEGVWDLACCVEVAEHVPPERSEELVDVLVRLSRRWIFFTAAPPEQGGRGHGINDHPGLEGAYQDVGRQIRDDQHGRDEGEHKIERAAQEGLVNFRRVFRATG